MSKPAPRRDTRVWRPPPLAIVCPRCKTTLGRCSDTETRDRALTTHSQHCKGTPDD